MLVNGRPALLLPVNDRGLQYGDGLFETLRIRQGRPAHWQRHLERLREGCRRLGFEMPDAVVLETEARLIAAEYPEGILKLMVTRGSGPRGYRPPVAPSPTRILTGSPVPDTPPGWRRDGVQVRICRMRLSSNPALAGIKHLNRLEQVLARSEWDDEHQEGLMLDGEHRVVEGTMSNLFLIRDGALLTPWLDRCGVAGITRGRIMDIAAAMGVACTQTRIGPQDLFRADGLLLCNTLIGIWPVRCLEGRPLPVPDLVRELQRRLENPDQ
ncbi:aminodeoxychorismate lyase [Ectothiorhodospira lacustris]|uniref:aminodeoxychorismate lyase n=1 Tax=Ectothiorhodospira lacustris TaxID=2899127 RepID=UPI001EE902DC|nr:aminodeoxychorismate lyase [Ectothiorhodospira lacustris]MCG5500515.1 aminodeoxychorismate lyase [Ectothiorhodospira lacustris]MCG5510171.1 aminodeoxychorismate lyase [Ectothiorhodospira lacustris]MCG5522014.1 aminodeoxychorismate lyase [Ectothiorhodospira lacustris]